MAIRARARHMTASDSHLAGTPMSTTMALKDPAPVGASRKSTPRLALGIALAIFAAHVPLLFVHFQQLWLKPHYQLFPIVLAGAFVLVWPLAHYLYATSPGGLRYGIGCVMAGAIFVGIGWLID